MRRSACCMCRTRGANLAELRQMLDAQHRRASQVAGIIPPSCWQPPRIAVPAS